MKIFFSFLICISILIPAKVFAVDISVGATTWYAWMERDYTQEPFSMFKAKLDPAFFYGPVVSVKLNDDFNLTFIYLYGKFDMTIDRGMYGDMKCEFKRQDADLALNYRLNNYFKAFAGVKYIGHEMSMERLGGTLKHDACGPGLGLSLVFPITDNVFLLGNTGGIYLWGKAKFIDSGNTGNSGKMGNYKEYGLNSTLSLAYYIVPASTTISLGGRFQYIKTECYDRHAIAELVGFMSNETKFYGLTLTATYSFEI
jgi:hypothetical protein